VEGECRLSEAYHTDLYALYRVTRYIHVDFIGSKFQMLLTLTTEALIQKQLPVIFHS
jgi:hypothetical protein